MKLLSFKKLSYHNHLSLTIVSIIVLPVFSPLCLFAAGGLSFPDFPEFIFWEYDYEQALKYLLLSADDDYELAYGDIGIIYYREKNDMTNALKWFQKAEQIDCLYPPAAYEYGMLLLEKGNTDEALKKLLIAADGKYELAYEEIGEIYHQRNDIENADKWFKKAEEETWI